MKRLVSGGRSPVVCGCGEPLEQTYHRIADALYRYESAGGSFVRELTVNGAGREDGSSSRQE